MQLGLADFQLLGDSGIVWRGLLRQISGARIQLKLVGQEIDELLGHLLLHLIELAMLLLPALNTQDMGRGHTAFRAGHRIVIPYLDIIRTDSPAAPKSSVTSQKYRP